MAIYAQLIEMFKLENKLPGRQPWPESSDLLHKCVFISCSNAAYV